MNLQDDTIQLLVDLVEKEQRRLDQFQPDSQDYARRFHALMDRFTDDQPLRKELLGRRNPDALNQGPPARAGAIETTVKTAGRTYPLPAVFVIPLEDVWILPGEGAVFLEKSVELWYF